MHRARIRTPPRQRNLNRRRPPGNKLCQPPLPDSQQRLVDFSRVHVALDDVEDGDVSGFFGRGEGDHAVLWLEEAAHDVEDRGFLDCFGL